ncbi:LysE family translocator [Arcobacter sp. LA11]|uniref:LysE family translocator n=1 Tax=Arcobacter sp. LA11 TaxID=1898176 RepID=UPI000933AC03|nr:LysE family translocator [Arcobacter sp. LA11]
MNIDILLTFATISLLLVISPGPNGVLILKTVPLHGKKSAMNNVLGIFTATYLHGILSFFGLSAIILSSAELFMVIKILGALYLLFLGIKSFYSIIKKDEEVKEVLQEKIKKEKKRSHALSFMEGFLTQILNPKVSMFYLAAFPQLIDFKNAVFMDIFLLTSIHAMTMLVWFTLFILLLGKSSKAFESKIVKNLVQGLTGTVFLYFSYKILNVETSK